MLKQQTIKLNHQLKYLSPCDFSPVEAKFTFLCRSRMLPVGENYKKGAKNNPPCPLCKTDEDTQKHLMVCAKFNSGTVSATNIPIYDDLFDTNLEKQLTVAQILRKNLQTRNKMLKPQ